MFFGKKKTQLEILIDKDGLEHAAKRLAEILNEKIPSLVVARQFIFEELDAARQGNSNAKSFAAQSGIPLNEYENAMKKSWEEVDGANGPQQLLHHILLSQLDHDRDLMLQMRFKVVEHIMKKWNLGTYALDNSSENGMDWFAFDNSANVLSAPKGQSQLIALLNVLEMILKDQMWHVQKIDYAKKHPEGILFAVVAQAYLKFNGPDMKEAKAVEASECTLGIIENDLDVFPTVLMQLSFNFYQNDIEAELQMFDSRPKGGYNTIRGLSSLIDFTRDELLGSFAHANPGSELAQLLNQEPLFESIPLLSRTFKGGLADLAEHLPEFMQEVGQKAIHATINL
jgi:hypothetical protein